MVTEDELKLFSVMFVNEMDNLSAESKLSFIKQIKNDEITLTEVVMVGGDSDVMAATYAAALIISGAFIVYTRFMNRAKEICKEKKGLDSKNCLTDYQIKGQQKRIDAIKNKTDTCKRTKNEKKCMSKLEEKIVEIETIIDKLNKKRR